MNKKEPTSFVDLLVIAATMKGDMKKAAYFTTNGDESLYRSIIAFYLAMSLNRHIQKVLVKTSITVSITYLPESRGCTEPPVIHIQYIPEINDPRTLTSTDMFDMFTFIRWGIVSSDIWKPASVITRFKLDETTMNPEILTKEHGSAMPWDKIFPDIEQIIQHGWEFDQMYGKRQITPTKIETPPKMGHEITQLWKPEEVPTIMDEDFNTTEHNAVLLGRVRRRLRKQYCYEQSRMHANPSCSTSYKCAQSRVHLIDKIYEIIGKKNPSNEKRS